MKRQFVHCVINFLFTPKGEKELTALTSTALFKGRTVALKVVARRSDLTREELQHLKAVFKSDLTPSSKKYSCYVC